jgi:alpha-1,2-mannosyltransferase/arabinofuranan 3-O-arabinosyltransferase
VLGRGALWAGAVAAIAMSGYLWVRFGSANLLRVESPAMAMHVDFETFHRSAAALLHHGLLYVTGAMVPNLDPPASTVVYAPFGWLPMLPAYRLFALLTAIGMLGCYAVVAREARLSGSVCGLALCAMLVSSPMLSTIALGQIYGLLLAGLAGAWLADRRDRPILAGVLLGLVVAVKPTLAPILLFAVARRHWPMAIAGFGGAAAGTLTGFVVAGPSQTWAWLKLMSHTTISSSGDNASLPALAERLGGPAWLGFALGAVVVGLTLLRIWRGADREIALWWVIAAALLLSPVAWNNYLVLAFPGVLLLLARRRLACAALLLALPLIGVEWAWLFHGNGLFARAGHSFYCVILFGYWLALRPARTPTAEETLAALDWTEPVTAEADRPEMPASRG